MAAGGVAAVAGGVSSVASKVGESVGSNAPSQTYTGGGYPQPQAGGLSSSLMERLAELEAQKKDAIARDDLVLAQSIKAQMEALRNQSAPSGVPAPPPPPPPASAPSNGKSSSIASVMMGGSKAVLNAGSGAAGLLAGGVGAVGSAVGLSSGGPGSGAGDPSADIALGIVGAFFELIAAAVPACGADNAQMELASHIDATVASRNLNDLGARLLDFWYVLRPDALSSWSLLHQQQWVWTAYGIKYGDIRAAPKGMGRAMCGLLLELGGGCRSTMLTWDPAQADIWADSLRTLAHMIDATPPPAGWGFPSFVVARNGPGCVNLDFGQTGYCVARSGGSFGKAHGQEVLMALKSGGVVRNQQASLAGSIDEGMQKLVPRDLIGDHKTLVTQAGGPKLHEKCDEKCARLFTQKTKPIHFHNQGSTPLKVCLYGDTDRLCAVPVGGLGGPCVTTLDPNCRAQMRPPGKATRFQLKAMAPGIIETNLYFANVLRGQHVQLRGRDCTVEDK